jgi:hypothetical protein
MNRSFTEAEMGGSGDILEDMRDKWNRANNVKAAYELALEKYVGPMILEETGEGLEQILEGLIPGLLMTLLVVVGSTAVGATIGAAIGFFFGGVGAGPGALVGAKAGLTLGLWLLEWMGVAFLIIYIAENFGEVLELIKSGITRAWNARDNRSAEKEKEEVDRGARDLARAVAVVVRLVLEGIVQYLLAKGTAAVASRLAQLVGILRKSKFGNGFAEWVAKNYQKLFENPKLNRKKGSTAQEHPSPPSASPGAAAPSGGKPQTGADTAKTKAGSGTGKSRAGLEGRGHRPQPGERSTTRAEWKKSQQAKRLVNRNVPPRLRDKILYGERVANPASPGGVSNRVIGGHSPRIKTRPDYDYETISNNADGTTSVKFIKQFPDGNISQIKKSTLAPDHWSDDKIIATTNDVSLSPVVDTRARDGATLHRQTVNGVQWEVIKDSSGKITSSYPTGGNPSQPGMW